MLGLAGWLFAELALVLVVIVMGAEAPKPKASPPTPSPTATPRPTTSPRPTGKAPQPGLRLDSVLFTVPVPPNGGDAVERFKAGVAANVKRGERIGLILLFGVSRTADSLGGTAVSRQLVDQLVAARVPGLPPVKHIRPYLGSTLDAEPGWVKVELFLMTDVG
ncbi:hypothetical protein GCM10023148_58250 [Actinokineospora soli]